MGDRCIWTGSTVQYIHITLHLHSQCTPTHPHIPHSQCTPTHPPTHTFQTKESNQGSYSRVLDDSDRVHEIQQRWQDEKNSWFTLCRTPNTVQDDSLLGSPTSPVSLLSPTNEDDNYVVLVEEGCGSSPTFSDLMSDSYFSTTASDSSRVSPPRTNTAGSNTENSPPSFSPDVKLGSNGRQNVVDDALEILVDEMSSRSSLRTTSTSTQMSVCALFGSHDDCRSPDSLLNSSSYTCSTESMTHSDPFDNSLDNPTDIASSAFSRASCLAQRRFSSPESYSFQRDARMAAKKTGARVHFDNEVLSPGTASATSKQCNTNVAMETETNHIALHSMRRHFSDSGSPMGPRESQGTGLKLSSLMQKSIDEGMSGMMNRVVNEQRQRQRSWTNTEVEPQSKLKPRIATSFIFKEGVMFQPLVCSPVHSEERKYPQFVFAAPAVPEGDSSERDGGEDRKRDVGEEGRQFSALDENMLKRTEKRNQGRRLAADKTTEYLKEVAKHQRGVEGEGEPSTGVDHKSQVMGCRGADEKTPGEEGSISLHSQPVPATIHRERENSDSQSSNEVNVGEARPPNQQWSHWEFPYYYHRTSKTIPAVLVESKLTIHPTFQTHASLYPTFLHCDYFSSEMDLLESLSTLMDIKLAASKLKPHKREQSSSMEKQKFSDIDSLALSPRRKPLVPDQKPSPSLILPPQASLISPSRGSRLISQPARAVNLRRPHSFNVRQDYSATNDERSSLISPARRDHLIQQAALALRSKYQASKLSQLGEESHRGVQAGQSDEDSEPLPSTNPQLDEERLQRNARGPGTDLEMNTTSPQLSPGVTNGSQSNPQLLSVSLPTTGSHSLPHTSMQSHSNQPPPRPSSATYPNTHGCFSTADLTVNIHQRKPSFSDSVGDSSSSLSTRRSRSATPSWPHGSVETIATVPSNLQPSRPKSLSYLSVLQQVEKAATRKHYSTENTNAGQQRSLKGFQSVEVLNTGTQRELLYRFGPQRRPVTVIVSNKATSRSTLSLSNPQSLPRHLKRTPAQGYPKFSSTQHLEVSELPTIY